MTITATDSASGTYHIKKLFDRTAVVYPGSGTQFTENQKVSWNMNAAVASTSIKIATNN
jgi:predicted nucleic acid-binding Zn ribbon protein